MNETNGTIIDPKYVFDDVPRVSKITTVSCCLAMSLLYVSSLYIWDNKLNRDHPNTIKRRFLSVTLVMFLAPIFVYKFSSNELLEKVAFNELLGLRWQGLAMAIMVPYLLTVMLFLGPLCVELHTDMRLLFYEKGFCQWDRGNYLWIRNYFMAPLTEEFVFRACMTPLILQSFAPLTTVFVTPLFFGVAHIHHIVDRIRMGMDISTALIISLSQLTYTTLFGIYSAFLFARTGHFIAPFFVHAFCNYMGFPDFRYLWIQKLWKRLIFIIFYFIGFIAWILLLDSATKPELYRNNIYWP